MNDNTPQDTANPALDEKRPLLERLRQSADTADNANYYRRLEDMRWGWSPTDTP